MFRGRGGGGDDILLQSVYEAGDVGYRVEFIVPDQRSQVHRPLHCGLLVGGVGVAESGVGRAPSEDGEIVALAAVDLGGEHLVQGAGEFGPGRDRHRGLLAVDEPVEVSPDFAAVGFTRSLRLGQLADGLQATEGAADVGVMLVREVVQIDDLGSAGFEDMTKVVAHRLLVGVAHGLAGMAELSHEGVSADHRGGLLFADAFGRDLVVGPVFEATGPRRAAAVGDGHPAEPLVIPVIAGEDAMEGHELEVVLVGADAEVGGPAEGFRDGRAVGDHQAGAGVEGCHRRREGREAAATACP